MTVIAGGPENANVAVAFGANSQPLILAGETWRLIVSMFLHGGWLHLLINGYALFLLGSNLEAFYGPWRFLFLYLVAGMLGSIASAAMAAVVSVGASGGIFGLLGGSIVFAFKYRRILPPRVTRVMGTALLPWVVLNVVLGFVVPRIDMNAHLGGLLGGALIALFLTPRSLLAPLGRSEPEVTRMLAAVCVALLVTSFAGAAQNIASTRGPDGPVLPAWQYEALAGIERDATQELVEKGLQKHPDSFELLWVRAQIRMQREEWEGAISDYRRLQEIVPENPQILNNLAWMLLEEAPEPWRDVEEAERLARRALARAPQDPYVLGTFGTARLRRGDAVDAVEYLQRALERERGRPGETTDRYLLAIALARAGRGEEAREALAQAVRGEPRNDYRGEAEAAVAGSVTQSAPAP